MRPKGFWGVVGLWDTWDRRYTLYIRKNFSLIGINWKPLDKKLSYARKRKVVFLSHTSHRVGKALGRKGFGVGQAVPRGPTCPTK